MVTGSFLSHLWPTHRRRNASNTASAPVVQFLIRHAPERAQHRQQDQQHLPRISRDASPVARASRLGLSDHPLHSPCARCRSREHQRRVCGISYRHAKPSCPVDRAGGADPVRHCDYVPDGIPALINGFRTPFAVPSPTPPPRQASRAAGCRLNQRLLAHPTHP